MTTTALRSDTTLAHSSHCFELDAIVVATPAETHYQGT
jgi:hypothetical protein